MGGHHALTVALNHHDQFNWIGAFSSAPPPTNSVSGGLNDSAGVNKDLKLFWIACGKQDFLFKGNNDFDALLKEKGIRHQYVVTEGDHPACPIKTFPCAPAAWRRASSASRAGPVSFA